jgi:MFS family permease
MSEDKIDSSRLRSLIGVVCSQLGSRAYSNVTGLLLTLLISSKDPNPIAITFGLSSGRLLSWLLLPLVGRFSDKSETAIGRRVPYIGISTIILGISVYFYPSAPTYWSLFGLILVSKLASTAFSLTSFAVVPEIVGRSRWIKALVLVGIGAIVIGGVIKGTVITTWKQNVPSTYGPPFRLSGLILIGAGIIVLLFVREARATKEVAKKDKEIILKRKISQDIKEVLKVPNAYPLIIGALCFWAGVGATVNLGALFFNNELHAGAGNQIILGIALIIPGLIVGLVGGIYLAKILSKKQAAVFCPMAGAVCFTAMLFVKNLFEVGVISVIGSPFLVCYLFSLSAFYVQLLPKTGGIGERVGLLTSPFSFVSVTFGFLASVLVDHYNNDYRIIWFIPAVMGLVHGLVMLFIKVPAWAQRTRVDFIRGRLRSLFRGRSFGSFKTGLFTGEVTADDADASLVFDRIRQIFPDPYDEVAYQRMYRFSKDAETNA